MVFERVGSNAGRLFEETRLVVGEADLVDEEAHELGGGEGRVGVVHLDSHLADTGGHGRGAGGG